MISPDELRHLTVGPRPGEKPQGAGLIAARLQAVDASSTLSRARSVMVTVLSLEDGEPSLAQWSDRLPKWFVQSCADEPTAAETQQWLAWWRGLDAEAKASAEENSRWTLSNWLYFFEPEERQWYWWDAGTTDDDEAVVWLEVIGWPTPLGALSWLLRAAGATAVQFGED